MKVASCSAVVGIALLTSSCVFGGATIRMPDKPPTAAQLAELWVDPGTETRDLFWGIGGKRYAPPKDATYRFVSKDETGFSISYDVTSPDGTEWSAKIGPEAQTEVVVSRILWGLGYHQPPVYYLPSWNLAVGKGDGELKKESEARFRPKIPNLKRSEEYWEWQDNPFVGTRPLNGLLVVLLMVNSTDLKNDNNSIYELTEPWDGASRWFVVRDLGAALGETGKLFPRRNWIDAFEKQGFITGIKDGQLEFDYDGRHQELIQMIKPPDVRWAASRMQLLTEAQWRDAFRAGNYADEIAERYIRKIKEKIAQGLALEASTTDEDR
jgi:hypothetical protein